MININRREFITGGVLVAASAVLAACNRPVKEAIGTLIPTKELPSLTPGYTATVTATGTVIPVATASPFFTETATPWPTETVVLDEKNQFRNFLQTNWNSVTTRYLGGINYLVDEITGEAVVSIEAFKSHFIYRDELAVEGLPVNQADIAFAQLNQPVKDLHDRGLDFHKRNDGQGLGFKQEDLPFLRKFEDAVSMVATGSYIANERDGYDRAWILAKARNIDQSVLATVDNWLIGQGYVPTDERVQGIRHDTFNRVIYGDLGIIPTEDGGGGEWWTVTNNGRFDVACSTYMADASARSQQDEASRLLEFYPYQEVQGNKMEEEKETKIDADDQALIVGVAGPDGYLRVETYILSNTPDGSNPGMDAGYGVGLPATFYRCLPCGEEAPEIDTPQAATKTPRSQTTPIEVTPTPKRKPTSTPQGPEPTVVDENPSSPPTQPIPKDQNTPEGKVDTPEPQVPPTPSI